MQDKIQDKRKRLYDGLVAAGYDAGADFKDFNNLMDSDEVARQWVYDTAKSEGWNVGESFDQFVGYITPTPQNIFTASQLGLKEDAPASAPANPTFTAQQLENGETAWDKYGKYDYAKMKPKEERDEYVTATEEQRRTEIPQYHSVTDSLDVYKSPGAMSQEEYSRHLDDMFDGKRVADNKARRFMNEAETAQMLDDKFKDMRKFGELKGGQGITAGRKDIIENNGRFYTPVGSYDSYEEAAHYIDANNLSKEDKELRKDVRKDIENDYYREQLSGLYDTIKGLKDEQRVYDIQEQNKYRKERSFGQAVKDAVMAIPVAEMQQLQGDIPSSGYDISAKGRFAKEQNDALTAAGRLYNEAQAIMSAAKSGNFIDGLNKALGSIDTWSSQQQARDNIAIGDVVRKWEEGRALTKAEQALLESLAVKTAINNEYQDEISNWYKAGEMVGEMAPFMVEMMINPLSGLSKKSATKFADWATKKYGKKLAAKVANAIGGLGGAVAGGYGMALTTGLPSLGTGIQERMLGKTTYGFDKDGDIEFTGQTEKKGLLRSGYEELTAKAIDNATEMLGAGYVSSLGSKIAKTAKGKKLFGWLDRLSDTKWGRGFKEFRKATNWNGPIEEFLEEIHAGIANTALVGDQSLKELFDKDNLATIAIGVAIPGVAISTAQTAGGIAQGAYKAGASDRRKMAEVGNLGTEIWRAGGKLEQWQDFMNSTAFGSLEDTDRLLTRIHRDNSLSNEEKAVAFDYAIHTLRLKTALGVKDAMNEGRASAIDNMLSDIYSSASSEAPSADALVEAESKLAMAEREAKDALGLTDKSIEDFMGDRSIDEVALENEDLRGKLLDYFKAKAEDEGRRDAIEEMKLTRYAEVDKSIDNTANKDDGMVYSATLPGGETVFITDGTVVLDNEGYIDVNRSRDLIALFPDNSKKAIEAGDIREKIEVSNAQEAKDARHAEIDSEIDAELSAPKNAFSVNAEDGAHTIEVVEDNGNGFFTIVDNGEQKIIDGAFLYEISGGQFGKPAEGVASVASENTQPVADNVQTTVEPIPTETRGKVKRTAYHVVPIERTLEDLENNELTEDEKIQFAQANIDEINSELQKVLKQEPKMGADIQAYKAAKNQWTVARDEWQKRLDYYNELLNRLKQPIQTSEVAPAVEGVAPQATNEMQPIEQAPIDNTAMEVAQETQNMQPVQEAVAEDQSGENNEMVEPVGNTEQLEMSVTDNQGNPVDENGRLIVEEVATIDDITDADFDAPARNVQLPALPENVATAIGTNGKPVVIKKNVFEKNGNTHVELEPADSREILKSALYNPNIVGATQPIKRPDYKVAIRTGEKNAVVVIDVFQGKDHVEIVGWRQVNEKGLAKMQRQAEREGGQFLILSPNDGSAAALSALPFGLSSESEDRNIVSNEQENTQKSDENAENGGEIIYSQEELAEVKEQLGELNAISAPEFAARLFSIKPWKTLEEANAALKELLASYGETLNGQSLAVMPFLDKAQGLIREYNKSQEPRSVEEILENGDKRITNYNSRGEVATVATDSEPDSATSANEDELDIYLTELKAQHERQEAIYPKLPRPSSFVEAYASNDTDAINKLDKQLDDALQMLVPMDITMVEATIKGMKDRKSTIKAGSANERKEAPAYKAFDHIEKALAKRKKQLEKKLSEDEKRKVDIIRRGNREEWQEIPQPKQENKPVDEPINDEVPVNSEPTEQPETNEVANAGPVNVETLQLNMGDEDFNALLNGGDKTAISEYLAEMDGLLRIGVGSPLDGQEALREEYRKAVEQYGKENIPAEVMDDLNSRMQPYSDLSRAIFDRKYALQDKLREIEASEAQANELAEKEAKAEHKKTAFGGFLAGKTDLGAGSAEKALSKKYNFDGKVMTVAEFVEDAVGNGNVKLSAIEEPKYKGASRAAWNRMDARQQEADAKRVKESGTKTVYTVNDHDLGKTAYDYAKFLLDKKAELEKADAKKAVEDVIKPFAKEKREETKPATEKIEDVGEKIGGARKDIIRQYADKIKLDGKTFSTMFPKPDIDKLVEAGLPKDKVAAVKAMYDNAKREFEMVKKRRGKDKALQASLFYAMYAKNVLTGEEGDLDLSYNGFAFTEWGKEFMKANIALYKAVFNKLGTDYGKVDLRSYFITPLAAGMGKNFNLKKLNEENSRRLQRMAEMDGRKVPEYKDGDLINFVGEHYSRPSDQFETLEEAVNTMVERISKEVKVDEVAQYKVVSYWKRDAQGRADYTKAYLGIKVRGFGTVDVMEFKNMNEANTWLQNHKEDFQQMAAAKEEQVKAENKKPLPKYVLGHLYNEAQSQYSVFADFGKEGVRILKTFDIPQAEGVAAQAKVRSEVYKNEVLPYINSEEAVQSADGIAQEIRDAKNAKPKSITIEKKSRERVGVDWRNGKDATPEMFVDVEGKEPSVFGFRAIEFGNYVSQKERQQFLNDIYDALMDMSEILGVSPRALSLGGKLALAVGARGTNGASGHYEPYKNVINITKTSGAGVLAHEWLHAFDRYFSNFDENALYPNGVMYATQGLFADDTRQEVKDAFERVMTAIKGSDYQKRSMLLGEYWASKKELAARALQDYIIRKLDDRGQKNDFLSNHVAPEEWDGDAKGYPFPLGEDAKRIADAFDNLFATLEEKTTEDGNVVLYRTAEDIETAPETASVQDEHQPTVVSSADGAKVLKDLDNAIKEYENKSSYPKTLLGDVAKVLNAKKHGSNSQYATFEAVNGKVFTIRLANHNAKISTFDNHDESEGISIVVTAQDNNGITNDGEAHVVEFFYDAIKLRKADGKPLVEILKSIKQALYSGEYKDNTGLATREEVNEDVLYRIFGGNNGYVGYSMSKRAAEAREEGRFPKTDFKKEYGVTDKELKALVDAGIISDKEWHHTSMYGNKTTFYGFENKGASDFFNENRERVKEAIKNGTLDELVPEFQQAAEVFEDAEFENFRKEQEEKRLRDEYNKFINNSTIPAEYIASNGVVVNTDGKNHDAFWIASKDGERLTKRRGKEERDVAFAELREKLNEERAKLPTFEQWKSENLTREGEGSIADREVVMDSDPYSKALGRPRYTGRKMGEYVARQRMEMAKRVKALAQKLNLNIDVLESTEGLSGKRAKAKGWYEPKGKRIVVVIPNHTSVNDAVATVLHEAVAHHGLRELFGENFDTFLQNVYNNADADVREAIETLAAQRYNGNLLTATEEYLASLAENTDFEYATKSGWWERIKDYFFKMLRGLGIEGFSGITLTDNELRYILWRSYQNLTNPGMYNNVFGRVKDTAKQYELKVGDYAPAVQNGSMVAGEDINNSYAELSYEEAVQIADDFAKTFKGAAKNVVISRGKDALEQQMREAGFLEVSIKTALENYNEDRKLPLGGYLDKSDGIVVYKYTTDEDLYKTLWHENTHRAIKKIYGTVPAILQTRFDELPARIKDKVVKELAAAGYKKNEFAEEAVCYFVGGLPKAIGYLKNGKNDVVNYFRTYEKEFKRFVNFAQGLIDYTVYGQGEITGDSTDGLFREMGGGSAQTTRSGDAVYQRNAENDGERRGTLETTADDTRFRIEENSIDNVPTQPLTFTEKITNSVLEASARNKENLTQRSEALRAYGSNLANVLKLMQAQRVYDKSTVDTLMKMAKMYFKNAQLLGHITPYEAGRIMSVLHGAVGKRDVTNDANKLVGILVDAHSKELQGLLDKAAKTKAKKVNASGVEVMGSLDKMGQIALEAYNEAVDLDEKAIEDKLYEAQNDTAHPEEAEARINGLMMAREYVTDIKQKKQEIKDLQALLKEKAKDAREGNMSRREWKEFKKATVVAIMEDKLGVIDAYHSLIYRMSTDISKASARAKAFQKSVIDHTREIQHFANSDMQGRSASAQGELPTKYNNAVLRGLMSGAPTFQYMLKKFGEKDVDGKGYLYDYFMGAVTKAKDKEFNGKLGNTLLMEAKLEELFGKKMKIADLYKYMRADGTTLTYREGGEMREMEISQGQMLYIYMLNKMADGRMKLSGMGITGDVVAKMAEELPKELVAFADWVQDDFLTKLREKYNIVHERMFGAPMAAIENYFHIKVNKRSIGSKEDISKDIENDKLSTMTGAIIKRTKNAAPIDLSVDALSALLDHINEMEHWAAFAEFNRDVNTLVNYNHFKNQVMNMSSFRYGSGKTLWENFRKTAQVVSGTYRPEQNNIDKAVLNISKGVTASKIAFRGYTAVKQVLSAPAFWSEASVDNLLFCYVNPKGSCEWAMEFLPGFKERWMGRMMGNEKLLPQDSDWKIWRNNFVKNATRIGMTPNAAVDALTVAQGARAVYLTKMEAYKKAGYTEQRANEKALQAAAEAYNESQQSSMGAYISPIQASGTAMTSLLTTFKNANFGYTRKTAQSLANIKRHTEKGYKEEAIAYMTKKFMREGLTEEQAKKLAERRYKRSVYRDSANVALFGFGLNMLWMLGGSAIYLLAGDDDEKKEELVNEALIRGALGSLDGIPLGETLANWATASMMGEDAQLRMPRLIAVNDFENIVQIMKSDRVRGAYELANMFIAMGIGVNPTTFVDAFMAFADVEEWSAEEVAMLALKILNAPKSQLEQLEVDKAMANGGVDATEVMRRYVEQRTRKQAPGLQGLYSDENLQKVWTKNAKRFDRFLDERLENVIEDDFAFRMFYDDADAMTRAKISEMREKYLKGDDKAFVKKELEDVINGVYFGAEKKTVYYGLANEDDLNEDFELKQMIALLSPVYSEYLKMKDGLQKGNFFNEHKDEIVLYKNLNARKSKMDSMKKYMQDNPGLAEKNMREIRKLRTEAMNLISGYNE